MSLEQYVDLKAGDVLYLDIQVQFKHDVHIDSRVLKSVCTNAIREYVLKENGFVDFSNER